MPPVGDIRRGVWGRGELRETLGTGDLGEGVREGSMRLVCLMASNTRSTIMRTRTPKKYNKVYVHVLVQ